MHNDTRAANFIMSPGRRVSLIDLEKTGIGKYIFDVVGFVEHAKVESGLDILDPYMLIYDGKWVKKDSDSYYRIMVPAACVFKMSHLCGSAIKYHHDPDGWERTGRSRVGLYLTGMADYAGLLGKKSSGVLKSAADELEGIFLTLEHRLGKVKL